MKIIHPIFGKLMHLSVKIHRDDPYQVTTIITISFEHAQELWKSVTVKFPEHNNIINEFYNNYKKYIDNIPKLSNEPQFTIGKLVFRLYSILYEI